MTCVRQRLGHTWGYKLSASLVASMHCTDEGEDVDSIMTHSVAFDDRDYWDRHERRINISAASFPGEDDSKRCVLKACSKSYVGSMSSCC
jgi:hypothetical protein